MNNNSYANRVLIVLLSVFVLIVGGLLFSLNIKKTQQDLDLANGKQKNGVYVSGNTQYIDVTAKGGYSPSIINAKSGVDTVLKVKTSGTYDCSSALVIPSIGYRFNLPPTGITEVNIPPQAANTELKGTCSMGMYKFLIKFI